MPVNTNAGTYTPHRAKTAGQIAYEADLAFEPLYQDKTPRKSWHQLADFMQWSWERNPTSRNPSFDDAYLEMPGHRSR